MSPKSTRPVKYTPNATLRADIELAPERIEFVAANKVRVTLKTETGDVVAYTMKTASLVASVNMSVAVINNFTGQVLRDLGAL
jgi:hypothetical protein